MSATPAAPFRTLWLYCLALLFLGLDQSSRVTALLDELAIDTPAFVSVLGWYQTAVERTGFKRLGEYEEEALAAIRGKGAALAEAIQPTMQHYSSLLSQEIASLTQSFAVPAENSIEKVGGEEESKQIEKALPEVTSSTPAPSDAQVSASPLPLSSKDSLSPSATVLPAPAEISAPSPSDAAVLSSASLVSSPPSPSLDPTAHAGAAENGTPVTQSAPVTMLVPQAQEGQKNETGTAPLEKQMLPFTSSGMLGKVPADPFGDAPKALFGEFTGGTLRKAAAEASGKSLSTQAAKGASGQTAKGSFESLAGGTGTAGAGVPLEAAGAAGSAPSGNSCGAVPENSSKGAGGSSNTVAPESAVTVAEGGPSEFCGPPHKTVVLLVGDSFMMEGLGPVLLRALRGRADMAVYREAKYSTGLSRQDYFDWPQYMGKVLVQYAPDLVIVCIGANDAQDIIDETKKRHIAGTSTWEIQYRLRAEALASEVESAGAKLIWVGLPVMGRELHNQNIRKLSAQQAEVCSNSTARVYVNTLATLADAQGAYITFVKNAGGEYSRIRSPDKIHVTEAGGELLTQQVMLVVEKLFPH